MASKIPSCFKAYDIRGKVPEQLDEAMAQKIGQGLSTEIGLTRVVVGRDIRLSGVQIADALMAGLQQGGCTVLDRGMCGTEEMYHGVFSMEEQGVDGGVIVTASHNPANYNGMKIVLKGAKPLTADSGLLRLGEYVLRTTDESFSTLHGKREEIQCRDEYIEHLLSYVSLERLKPLKIVANCGNGCAGPVVDELEKQLPLTFIKLHPQPDGSFPNGVPNPLLPENREETSVAVKDSGADFGLAWDGDFDRCFFWDENGRFIEGYYLVSLLAKEMLRTSPKEKILYDPRLTWNTVEEVKRSGGTPIMTKTGHAFIKERMRLENALYGGEMSAHHYFRRFGYCDSGMIPWLLVAALLSRENRPLSTMVDDMMLAYPVSGEINSSVQDPDGIIEEIVKRYKNGRQEFVDGLSVEFDDYRFNIRKSNTEPLLRLNVESRGDIRLLEEKRDELLHIIRGG